MMMILLNVKSVVLLLLLLLLLQLYQPTTYYVCSFRSIIPIPSPKQRHGRYVPNKQQQQSTNIIRQQPPSQVVDHPLFVVLRYKPSTSDSDSDADNKDTNRRLVRRNDDDDERSDERFTNWIATLRRRPWTIRSDAVSNTDTNNVQDVDDDNKDYANRFEESERSRTSSTSSSISQSQEKSATQTLRPEQDEFPRIIIDENFFLKNPLSRVLNIETLLRYGEQQQQQRDDDDDDDDFVADDNQRAIVTGKGGVGVITKNNESTKKQQQQKQGITKTATAISVSDSSSTGSTKVLDLGSLIELSRWDQWVGDIWQSANDIGGSADVLLRQASVQIDLLVSNASSAVSSDTIQSLLEKSTLMLRQIYDTNQTTTTTTTTTLLQGTDEILSSSKEDDEVKSSTNNKKDDFLEMATKIAISRGLNMMEAADRARETTAFAASLVSVADGLLRKGYVRDDPFVVSSSTSKTTTTTTTVVPTTTVTKNSSSTKLLLQNIPILQSSKPLFADFTSAYEINTYTPDIRKSAEMGALSGAIYEETIPRTHGLDHTIVAQGLTNDVVWMITDSIGDNRSFALGGGGGGGSSPIINGKNDNSNINVEKPFLVRTITIRGFDAMDAAADRERLLINIVNATSKEIKIIKSSQQQQPQQSLLVHSGLLQIARAIYNEVKPFIIGTAPIHKIVLNGHSIGGSISFLLLLLMTQEYGAEYVTKRIARVYMFGSPPVVAIKKDDDSSERRPATKTNNDTTTKCKILDALDLPTSLVYSFVQPWDPISRLFSTIDPLYPLIGDIGDDGLTAWASGPYRTLRPVTKAICEAWQRWPQFRDVFRSAASQAYVGVGIQHLLLPEPTRYLADRFLAVNIPVPPIATILRLSSAELYPALESIFPLDTFEVSFIPQAIRSFVHHFYPAYGFPIVDYVKELERRAQGLPERTTEFNFPTTSSSSSQQKTTSSNNNGVLEQQQQQQGGDVELYDDDRKLYNYGIDWKKMLGGLRD